MQIAITQSQYKQDQFIEAFDQTLGIPTILWTKVWKIFTFYACPCVYFFIHIRLSTQLQTNLLQNCSWWFLHICSNLHNFKKDLPNNTNLRSMLTNSCFLDRIWRNFGRLLWLMGRFERVVDKGELYIYFTLLYLVFVSCLSSFCELLHVIFIL